MFVNFFIDRPIFASVLAIVIVVAGSVAIPFLPIAMFPQITPPQVVVQATYPGASAEVVEQTVTTPIEQQVNGVENMIYMSSRSGSDGTMTLNVTFKVGTDLDIAAVNVQNRVAVAQAKLPQDVVRQGLSITKQSPDLVEIVALTSPDGSRDELYLSNYATLQVVDVLARVPGVGQVTVFNGRDYGMRLWLNPDTLAGLGLTAGDVAAAVREQNLQAAAGQIGQPPAPRGQQFQYTVTTRGRLSTAAEFEDIILRTRSDGSVLRVRDVGRVELGSQSYGSFGRVGGTPAALVGVFQLPNANALDVSRGVQAAVARLAPSFPSGVTHSRPYNTTEFVRVSIEEVVQTLLIAIGLVILTVFVFLQDWRTTLIPTLTIPVSLVGTFAVISAFGFSINTLTLFGLVLAIGIVVDDAIVVVENTQRHLDEGNVDPREAARQAMVEVTGPVIATALVLMAVFIPIAFLPGITGELYRQFALTIAVSVALSALNAMTLTPALCALLLRSTVGTRQRFLARAWNASFARLTNGYDWTVRHIVRRAALALVVLLVLSGAAYALLRAVPTGFAPTEDQGYLLVAVQLPDAASLERTDAVVRQIEKMLLETEGVETVVAIGGRSFISGVNGPNVASLFPRLSPWSKRKRADLQADAILARLRARLGEIREAIVVAFPPPPIRGISSGGGFQFELQSVGGGSLADLDAVARQMMDGARQRRELATTYTAFRPGVPQLDAQVDRAKSKALGVPVSDVFESLQIFLGSLYVNDFNSFGRVWRVQLQAEPSYRATPSDIARLHVRSQPGPNGQAARMVPLSTLVTVKPVTGPDTISHYNLYRSAEIAGDTAPGASSGQAITAMQDLARRFLPPGMAYEWTGLAFQEIESGSWAPLVFALSALFVFLVLAAQYESWLVPLAVILAVPLGVLGALGALALRGLANDVYAQIGLALLIGLASKNAILIVEFAKARRERGLDIREAAREAARLRFRPILMTSFAFILGSFPLVVATGAGAASRHSIGTTVVGGMLAVTVLGVLLVPAFYVAVERLAEWRGPRRG
ncbi:MAG: hydrophobe/amphiphile efflux-1 family RND transporter [Candidatus Rokuibacteriota bacterium]|nr:MAG: hydrophobe/amphiphile efflux-1 family RND transporter [Candidatus Rokubacteria bacterium]